MIKKLFAFFLTLFVFINLFSQNAVYQLPVPLDITLKNSSFFYTLPKTAFKADIVVTKTSNIKGIYADFAEKLLGINNHCKENTTTYNLKSIFLSPFSVPDEKLQFVVELSSSQMKNNFLCSLYSKKNATAYYSSITSEKNSEDILPDFFSNYADIILQHTYETYTETKIIDGVVTQVPVSQTKTTSKTLLQQAQQAVDFIEKIREDRYAILSFSQETTLSKEAFEYLVNQLNDLEKKYLELFTGITVKEDLYESVVVTPKNESELLPLFSIVPEVGFSSNLSKTAAYNYYLRFAPHGSTKLQDNFRTMLSKQKKNTGYRIRKASSSFVFLVNGEKEEMLGSFPIFQFGFLEILPANFDTFDIGQWGEIY